MRCRSETLLVRCLYHESSMLAVPATLPRMCVQDAAVVPLLLGMLCVSGRGGHVPGRDLLPDLVWLRATLL